MIPGKITDSDMIILESVESFLKSHGTPIGNMGPQERIIVTQQHRDKLYSEIVHRIPRVAQYILSADMETDTIAQGLHMSLSKHVMDRAFTDILVQYLHTYGNRETVEITGAYLAQILGTWMEKNAKNPPKSKKGDKAEKEEKSDKELLEPVENLYATVVTLLNNIMSRVKVRCEGLSVYNIIAVSAALALENVEGIKQLMVLDLPITADVFDCSTADNPGNFVTAALLLEQTDVLKGSKNQSAFADSISRWAFTKLDALTTQEIFQILVAIYGTTKPNVETKFINPRDCGNKYPNLHSVAVQMISQR